MSTHDERAEKKAREIVQGWAFDIAEAHGTILPVNSTKPLIAAIATVAALEREVAEAVGLLQEVDEAASRHELGATLADAIEAFLAKHDEREEKK